VLIWGEETFLDGVDIQPVEFYRRLKTAKVMPSTSQVSPATLKSIYSELYENSYDILAILVSTELSGTIASAHQAKDMLPDARIEIVNSYSIAMALGFLAVEAAKMAVDGANIDECKAYVENAKSKIGVVFAVNTLEFLHRGGRIGGGARFIGSALNIKPILEIQDGKVEALERVRTRKKSLRRLIELVEARTGGQKPLRLATLHANAAVEAKGLLEEATNVLDVDETVFSEVSPVVGTHTGPGTIGLAYMAGV
jgi:DegV family protein with EDD domain